jgi:hypothetical protein
MQVGLRRVIFLVISLVVSIVLAFAFWSYRNAEGEARLVRLVERYDCLIDEGRFAEAETVAKEAVRDHPGVRVPECMVIELRALRGEQREQR